MSLYPVLKGEHYLAQYYHVHVYVPRMLSADYADFRPISDPNRERIQS